MVHEGLLRHRGWGADAHRRAAGPTDQFWPDPCRPPRRGALARLCDLGQWLWEAFRVSVSPQTLNRELRVVGYRKLSARPKHHPQAEGAIEAFKKDSRPLWRASRASKASVSTR